MKPHFKSYVICTSPRSGSTLLCKMLEATEVAGQPDSHFHVPSRAGWLAEYDLVAADFADDIGLLRAIFEAAMKAGTGQSNLFGLRMQRGSFDFFMEQAAILYPGAPTDLARLNAAFGSTCFIHLSRSDKLAQAISLCRAKQSGLWHRAADGSELERLAPPKEPQFDRAEIQSCMDELIEHHARWTTWFAREGIAPVDLTYEDLAVDPLNVLRSVLTVLGLPQEAADKVTVPTAKLADAQSASWAAQFRQE